MVYCIIHTFSRFQIIWTNGTSCYLPLTLSVSFTLRALLLSGLVR